MKFPPSEHLIVDPTGRVYCTFIDLEMALVRVARKELLDLLPGHGINSDTLRAL